MSFITSCQVSGKAKSRCSHNFFFNLINDKTASQEGHGGGLKEECDVNSQHLILKVHPKS